MKEQVKKWLENGDVDIFLGYRMVEGHPLPHFFVRERMEEVEALVDGPARYPLEKMAIKLAEEDPDIKIGLLARDCNQRALNVLFVWRQLKPENVKLIPVNCCPSPLKEQADCSLVSPPKIESHKKAIGIDNNMAVDDIKGFNKDERLMRWLYEFEKCIKCYGCRDACPVCFCKECSLEHHELVSTGDLPVEVPIFHLVRAVHMAGRCIDCGLCEDACPMDIPLRLLYKMVNQIVMELFDYKAGIDSSQSPFNIIGDEVTLEPKTLSGV